MWLITIAAYHSQIYTPEISIVSIKVQEVCYRGTYFDKIMKFGSNDLNMTVEFL